MADEEQEPVAPWSPLALVCGAILSAAISGALVIATAKAGISPGVSPLVVLIGWVVFGAALSGKSPAGKSDGTADGGESSASEFKQFLALLQVTGSGGAAVSAGLIFTAPILQIAASAMGEPVPDVHVGATLVSCLAGSLMGWGFVGLAAKRFLTDRRLPAPEAVACDQLIRTAAANPLDRPPISLSLLPALVAGFGVKCLQSLKYIPELALAAKIPLPGFAAANALKLPIPAVPLYLGIGALLTFPTAVLVFCGGLVNAATKAVSGQYQLANETYRWVGGAAMAVAVLYSLVNYVLEGRSKRTQLSEDSATPPEFDERLLETSGTMKSLLCLAIAVGGGLLIWLLAQTGLGLISVGVLGVVSLILVALLSGLGGLLSLQVGASASPVSGTVFMAMLVLSLTAMGLSMSGFVAIAALQPVLVACCVAIAAANDSSQDYKTMQLNGFRVSAAFPGQFIGCIVGACVVPISLNIAHSAYGLGTEDLPCPQASFFGTVLQSLFDPNGTIPWNPVLVGAGLGCVAVAIEIIGRKQGMILSSLAFAVGIYLPAEMGIGILLGNLARVIAAGSFTTASHRGILGAAGLIAGDAMLSLLLGVLIVSKVDLAKLEAAATSAQGMSLIALGIMLGLLAFTYLDTRAKR